MEHEERLKAALADRYQIEREIGRGGMATVYLAHDLKHNRQVAVKVLDPDLAQTLGAGRFLREIEMAAKLTHPHILPLHDSGEADGLLFYVMPYVRGESLRDRLTAGGPLPFEEAVQIALEVADALAYAHDEGVIHRDVKPANILLEAGHAVLADFGIAQAVAEAEATRLTKTGTSLGTVQYMSPEQVAAELELDARTDVYSLGCVLFEMLAGEPPFSGATPHAVIAKQATGQAPEVRQLRSEVSPSIEAAIQKALAFSKTDRFDTAGDLKKALETARGTLESPFSKKPGVPLLLGSGVVLLLLIGSWFLNQDRTRSRRDEIWALSVAIPEAERLAEEGRVGEAFTLAQQASALVGDSLLDGLWPLISLQVSITSDPSGAQVLRRPYGVSDTTWVPLGTTPLESQRLPREASILRFELEGYLPAIRAGLPQDLGEPVPLLAEGTVPEGLIRIPEARYSARYASPTFFHTDSVFLGPYLIDEFEVTNREYKEFVDAGGYQSPEYWEVPFERDGATIGWDEAIAEFRDRTGRPSPSTWAVSDYPDGEADFPVTGISWYEAAAYARFVGRELPTVYHWYRAVGWRLGPWLLSGSNVESDGPAPVGTHYGISHFGLRDVLGNAREWVHNASGDRRYILGGGWTDSGWGLVGAQATTPWDRSPTNGVRLVTYLTDGAELDRAKDPIVRFTRDFYNEIPVSNDAFETFLQLYRYDPIPLNPVVEVSDTAEDWIRERITFDAAYGGERMVLYLHKPRGTQPPFQTVVYFPGSNAIGQPSIEGSSIRAIEFITKSGRAFAYPVLKSTFERSDGFRYRRQDETNAHREHVIQWAKDIQRTIDYLETRPDIETQNLAYLGFSWGGLMGGIMLAVEKRFRAGILYVAGLSALPTQPVVDPFNFLSRISTPVLMLNGEYDYIFPYETSAKPMFDLLGTEDAHKRHVSAATQHTVPYDLLVEETLAWLDRYLGPVQR